MSGKSFRIDILTPVKKIYEGNITSLIVPAELGYLGILADHAPLIANIVPGKIIIKDPPAQPVVFVCKGAGIIEVFKNNVSLLVEDAEAVNSFFQTSRAAPST